MVTRAHDGRRMVIAAADAAARTHGLRPPMPLAHAMAMVPGLAVADADPDGDLQALRDLAAWSQGERVKGRCRNSCRRCSVPSWVMCSR